MGEIKRIDVLTEDGLRTYTETLVAWIKSKLAIKANDQFNIKLIFNGNQAKISLSSGETEISFASLPIVNGETPGLMTPTMLAMLGNGEGVSFQDLIDGSNVALTAMELGYIYVKDGKLYMPVQDPYGDEYNVIEFSNEGIKNLNNVEDFDLYATKEDLENITIAVDDELDEESENPLQNKVICTLFSDLNGQINSVSENIPDISTLTSNVDRNTTKINTIDETLKGINNIDIPGLKNRVTTLESDQEYILDCIEDLDDFKGKAIQIDGYNYTYDPNFGTITHHIFYPGGAYESKELDPGFYLVVYNGKYCIYDQENLEFHEIATKELFDNNIESINNNIANNLGKIIPIIYYGNINQSVINSAADRNFLYDITSNKLYQKVNDPDNNNMLQIGEPGNSFILAYEDPNDLETKTIYFICTISEGYKKLYTSDDGEFISKLDFISGVGNIISVKYFRDNLNDGDDNSDEGDYYFNTDSCELYVKYNYEWKSVSSEGKYLVLNNDAESDTKGQYFIIDIYNSYQKIALNAIEEIFIKSDQGIEPLSRNDNDNSVTIDLTGLNPSSSTTTDPGFKHRIIEAVYWQVQDLSQVTASQGTYATDSNNIIYIMDSSWKTIGGGNFLVTHQENVRETQKYALYLFSIHGGGTLTSEIIKLADFSDLGTTSGAVVDVMDNSGVTSYKDNNGVVRLPSFITSGMLSGILSSSYLTKNYCNETFATKADVDFNLWSNIVQFNTINKSLINVSNNRYNFNTQNDIAWRLIINLYDSEHVLMLEVTNRNNLKTYYKQWGEIPRSILPSSRYTTNDLYYTINDDTQLTFWKYNGIQKKYIPTDIPELISRISSIERSIETMSGEISSIDTNLPLIKTIQPELLAYSHESSAISNLDPGEYFILENTEDITNNSTLKKVVLNGETKTSQVVTEPCLVIVNNYEVYLYTLYNGAYKFIEIKTELNTEDPQQEQDVPNTVRNLVICNYWGVDPPEEGGDGYWYDETNITIKRFDYDEGTWISTQDTLNLLTELNLYINKQNNSIYRYDALENSMIKLSVGGSESSENITDEDLNLILKNVAELLEVQARRINNLKIDIDKISTTEVNRNINILKGYEFGYNSLSEYDGNKLPTSAQYGDLIRTKDGEIKECTASTIYPIVSIRCVGGKNVGGTENLVLPLIQKTAADGYGLETVSISITGSENESDIQNSLLAQFLNLGYKELDWNIIKTKEELAKHPKSVCKFFYSNYHYLFIVPEHYGTKVGTEDLGSSYASNQTQHKYFQGSEILVYCGWDSLSFGGKSGTVATWSNLNLNNNLTGSTLPNKGVVTGQCFYLVRDVTNSNGYSTRIHKPYWAYVSGTNVYWFDATGSEAPQDYVQQ